MAKTKHQKLADKMQAMFDAIQVHISKVAKQFNIELHFYQPYQVSGGPSMTLSALKSMFFTHYLNLQRLSPNASLRNVCQKLPVLGILCQPPIQRLSTCQQAGEDGRWRVLWKARVVCPEENLSNLNRSRGQKLLYCPREDEILNEIDWLEKDMRENSLTRQVLSVLEDERCLAIMQSNLLKDPILIWEKTKNEWRAEPSEDSNPDQTHDIADDPKNVDTVDFAPQQGYSLAFAHIAVLESIKERHCRHRQSLRKLYKKALENALFENMPWSKEEKNSFLHQWKDNVFGSEHPLRPKRPCRWKTCMGIDDVTAAKLIEHFASEFIANPKNKKLGEIACVLWILVWNAEEKDEPRITIKQALRLSSQDIVENDAAIIVNGVQLTISWGLLDLLRCLRGEGRGKRACRLFKNLDLSGKTLERALIEASKTVLPNKADSVLPAAFLIQPHVYQGIRMTSAQRAAMRNIKPIEPFYPTRKEIKKALLNERQRLTSAK
jgi:hypothetical protein